MRGDRAAGQEPEGGRDGADLGPALARLAATCASAEDELFSVIPILGEPVGQRALDDWVDQGVDLLRAIGESVTELDQRLAVARAATGAGAAAGDRPGPGDPAQPGRAEGAAALAPVHPPLRPAAPGYDEGLPE